MPSCAFLNCLNNTRNANKSSGITFHSFPKDVEIKRKWIEIIRLDRRDNYWMWNKFARICSDHFSRNEVYMSEKGMRRISKTAVPKIQLQEMQSGYYNGTPKSSMRDEDEQSGITESDTQESITVKQEYSDDYEDENMATADGHKQTITVSMDPADIVPNGQQSPRDSIAFFGDYISSKLRAYPERVKSIVQHKISDILFQADMGQYDLPQTFVESQSQQMNSDPLNPNKLSQGFNSD